MRSAKARYGDAAPFTPNWRAAVSVGFQYLTEVREFRSGAEQRESNRTEPRISVECEVVSAQDQARQLRYDLDAAQNSLFTFPMDWRSAKTISGAATGADTVVLAEAPFWATEGAFVIVDAPGFRQSNQIVSVAAGIVTLAESLPEAAPAGSRLVQGVKGRYADEVRLSALTDDVFRAAIRFEGAPGLNRVVLPEDTLTLYQGREVLTQKPNWASPVDVSARRTRDVADFTFGCTSVFSPHAFGRLSIGMGFSFRDGLSAERLAAVFHRAKGRRGAFWVPTRLSDMKPRQLAASGSTTVEFEGPAVANAYGASEIFGRVMVEFSDGTRQFNEVSSLSVIGGNSRMSVSTPWARDVTPQTRVQWLLLCRSVSDDLSVEWVTSQVAQARLNVISLKHSEAAL